MPLKVDLRSRAASPAVTQTINQPFRPLPYVLLLASLAFIFIIEFYPFINGVSFSFHKGSLLSTGAFVGLGNYLRLFNSPSFYNSLWFSFIFAFFNVLVSYVLGLALALFLNLDFPGRGFCRVALLVPWIVPAVVSIVSWKWLIADKGGLVNVILSSFGAGPIYFFSQSGWAMVAVIVIKIWRSFPFMLLSLLAALQVIDKTFYEAARMGIVGCGEVGLTPQNGEMQSAFRHSGESAAPSGLAEPLQMRRTFHVMKSAGYLTCHRTGSSREASVTICLRKPAGLCPGGGRRRRSIIDVTTLSSIH